MRAYVAEVFLLIPIEEVTVYLPVAVDIYMDGHEHEALLRGHMISMLYAFSFVFANRMMLAP